MRTKTFLIAVCAVVAAAVFIAAPVSAELSSEDVLFANEDIR